MPTENKDVFAKEPPAANVPTNSIYNVQPAVQELNRIEGFNPAQYLRKIETLDGGQMLTMDTPFKKLWFRLCHKHGRIVPELKFVKDGYALCEAKIYTENEDGTYSLLASNYGQAYFDNETPYGRKFIETAVTRAIGRALSDAGFGVQFADLLEGADPEITEQGILLDNEAGYVKVKGEITEEQIKMISSEAAAQASPVQPPAAKVVMEEPAVTEPEAQPADSTAETDEPLDANLLVEELLEKMDEPYARSVIIEDGVFAGETLGHVFDIRRDSIKFYADRGKNNLIRAAAQLLLNTAQQAAS